MYKLSSLGELVARVILLDTLLVFIKSDKRRGRSLFSGFCGRRP